MRGSASWVFVAALSATVHSSPIGLPPITEPVMGTLGDSWASGVTYAASGATDYDGNKDGCMRLKDAYGPQLSDHHASNQVPKFTFAACSGARMEDMAQGKNQLAQLDKKTTLATMQAGGNDAGFYNIARDCIFHNEPKDYGGAYPDAGACSTTISIAEDYIMKDPKDKGLYFDMHQTIQDVLDQQKSKFDLYVIGYAHFFNVDSPDSDWCNDASFTVSWDETNPLNGKKRVPLSNELRSKINDLTTKLNNQISSVVASFKTDKVKFVDVTAGFNGHRFCEPGSNEFLDRWGNNNVWFWNASPNGFFSVTTQEADQEKSFNASYFSSSPVNNFNWIDLLNFDKASKDVTGPWQGASPGIALRPFHPTSAGHNSIMKSINQARL